MIKSILFTVFILKVVQCQYLSPYGKQIFARPTFDYDQEELIARSHENEKVLKPKFQDLVVQSPVTNQKHVQLVIPLESLRSQKTPSTSTTVKNSDKSTPKFTNDLVEALSHGLQAVQVLGPALSLFDGLRPHGHGHVYAHGHGHGHGHVHKHSGGSLIGGSPLTYATYAAPYITTVPIQIASPYVAPGYFKYPGHHHHLKTGHHHHHHPHGVVYKVLPEDDVESFKGRTNSQVENEYEEETMTQNKEEEISSVPIATESTSVKYRREQSKSKLATSTPAPSLEEDKMESEETKKSKKSGKKSKFEARLV